jgi:lipid II:glycine glycyltransferase (peptidoglycan interpeptide bridge formation enzyme)
VRKAGIRLVRFRVVTIPLVNEFSINEEKIFLSEVVAYFKSARADMIIPATTNAIFRTYPCGADVAPYGTYVIDLKQEEETIWGKIDRITRQNIKSAMKKGVTVRNGVEDLNVVHELIVQTFGRSNISFMSNDAFKRYVNGLGENGAVIIADCNGIPQSYVVFAFSRYCAYAVYAGNIANQEQGANKLLYWEAIRFFKKKGIRRYDFVGARINPDRGSKQESINALKRRFGSELVQGYTWKYPLNSVRAGVYSLAVRFLRGGDIVDAERHKMDAT